MCFLGSPASKTHYLKKLDYNGIDVESSLFGINSTNLVTPQKEVYAQPKQLQNVQFFQRF